MSKMFFMRIYHILNFRRFKVSGFEVSCNDELLVFFMVTVSSSFSYSFLKFLLKLFPNSIIIDFFKWLFAPSISNVEIEVSISDKIK